MSPIGSARGLLAALATLAFAAAIFAATGWSRPDMPGAFYRAWWFVTAVLAAGSVVGLLRSARNSFAWGAFAVIVGPFSIALDALVSGQRALGVACLAFCAMITVLMKRSYAWFAEHDRARSNVRTLRERMV